MVAGLKEKRENAEHTVVTGRRKERAAVVAGLKEKIENAEHTVVTDRRRCSVVTGHWLSEKMQSRQCREKSTDRRREQSSRLVGEEKTARELVGEENRAHGEERTARGEERTARGEERTVRSEDSEERTGDEAVVVVRWSRWSGGQGWRRTVRVGHDESERSE
ncbi:hypothetical protein RJT34_12143 [Clitoria ternatea]|uniref:Uncharacterized protein n=1 Tax=Clitoria ternatea TaxID=43366 RepID=A0AAN9JNW1_CLITE